ncbi:MAG: hypothetical protein LBT44_01895 [Clostridiales bacterium]|jgi:hypothetical protein|nr:hypothetical protein [Clostridiales bacterium]
MKKIFIAVVLIAYAFPAAATLILGQSPPAANETPVAAPEFISEDGAVNWNFLSDFAAFINKCFAFRLELIHLNSALSAAFFDVSQADDVILGAEGWLYYEETIDDFLRKNVLSDEKIARISQTLARIEWNCAREGIQFLFVIAPNKNSIYPEYMPDLGPKHGAENNREKLLKRLQTDGVSHVDLFAVFNAYREEAKARQSEIAQNSTASSWAPDLIYYRLDTHWNKLGADLANAAILRALGREEEPFARRGVLYNIPREGNSDLYQMLYPKGREKELDVEFARAFTFMYDEPISDPGSMTIQTACENKPGSALVFRDSFGNALYPFLAESFGKAVFSRRTPYALELAEEYQADTLLIVMAERNIAQFEKFVNLEQP